MLGIVVSIIGHAVVDLLVAVVTEVTEETKK